MPEESLQGEGGPSDLLSVNATAQIDIKTMRAGFVGMSSKLESPGLSCHVMIDGKWTPKSLPPGKTLLKIGASASDCDICLPASPGVAKVHAILRLTQEQWLLTEYAQERSMSINGMKRPTTFLQPGSACIAKIGESNIVIQCQAASAKTEETSSQILPPCVLKTASSDIKMSVGVSALLGSHNSCRIKCAESSEFAGIVFFHGSFPCIYSIDRKSCQVVVDRDSTAKPKLLRHASVASFEGRELFRAELSDELREAAPQIQPSLDFKGRLALIEMSGGRIGAKLILPPSGQALYLGREEGCHFLLPSTNVSRKHAQMVIYDNAALCIDCKSTNGTFIEEERVSKKMLHPGELIRFGDMSYLLSHSE